MKMKYIFLHILFIAYISRIAFSQDFNMLDFSFEYSSNTSSFGQFNQLAEQPSYTAGIRYFHKENLCLSFLSNYIENSDSTLENGSYEFDFVVGYNYAFSEHFSIYPSYSRYIYDMNSNTIFSVYRNNFSLDASYNYKLFTTKLSGNYLTGDEIDYFVSFQNSFSFDIENFILNNSTISLNLEIDFDFGNQTYLNNYFWNNYQNNPEFRENLLNRRIVQMTISRIQQNNPDITEDEIIKYLSQNYISAEESFNLSSIGIILPFYYTIGNFGINAALSTYFFTNKPEYYVDDYMILFSVGLSYTFLIE